MSIIKKDFEVIKSDEKQDNIQIDINEDVDIEELMDAIDNIVNAVVDNDFDYSLIDLLESYYILRFFTNIEIEMKDEERNIPDYIDCYKKLIMYDIKNGLCDNSLVVYEYISYIEKNIWRKLEYYKDTIQNRKLDESLSDFYEIMDALNEVAEMNKDVDVEQLMIQLSELSSQIESVKSLQDMSDIED